jgi:putative transposase
MDGEIRYYVRDVLKELCRWKRIPIIQGNVQKDHIHMVMSIPPNYSVSSTIGFLKGKSAIKIFNKFHGLRKRYWGMHFWSPGYCVTTVGLDEEKIVKYVRWQNKKDQEGDDQQKLL